MLYLVIWVFASQAWGDIIEDIDDLQPQTEEGVTPTPPHKSKSKKPSHPASVKKSPQQTSEPNSEDTFVEEPPKTKKVKPSKGKKAPVKLKCDGQSTYSRKNGVMTLKENVVITQANLRLQADEAVVSFYKEKSEAENDSVKEVEIIGNVKVSKFDPDPAQRMVAHGNRAVFYNSEQKVKLIGNARLYRGGDLMRGKQITYDIQTGMVFVDQARGIVQPKGRD